jgi:hypothetical protein
MLLLLLPPLSPPLIPLSLTAGEGIDRALLLWISLFSVQWSW